MQDNFTKELQASLYCSEAARFFAMAYAANNAAWRVLAMMNLDRAAEELGYKLTPIETPAPSPGDRMRPEHVGSENPS